MDDDLEYLDAYRENEPDHSSRYDNGNIGSIISTLALWIFTIVLVVMALDAFGGAF